MQEQMSVWTGYTGAPCKELRRLQAGACGKRECQLEKGNMCGSEDLSQAEMRIIMKKYETVVFDLDGTLLNTLEDLADATNYALRTMQMPERTIGEVRAFVGNGVRDAQSGVLVQPQTYMNLSGESVRARMDYYKLTTDEIVIIYDDISMPVGQVRIRPKGSAGGHNGIKSIIAHLGTQEFPRIKIGVGAKPENGDLVKHVLGRFSKEDDAKIRDVFALAEEGLLAILQEDVKTAMNAVNGKKVGE